MATVVKSIRDPREVRLAQSGPRELKDPRSRAYAIQTLYALRRYLESAEIDGRRVREELDKIDRYQHWKVLGYPSKKALLQAETATAARLLREPGGNAAVERLLGGRARVVAAF